MAPEVYSLFVGPMTHRFIPEKSMIVKGWVFFNVENYPVSHYYMRIEVSKGLLLVLIHEEWRSVLR